MELIHKASHYNKGSIEVIEVIRDWDLNFCLGNTLKYIGRAEHKGKPIEDLKKASEYVSMEIEYRTKHKSCFDWLYKVVQQIKFKFKKRKYKVYNVANDWQLTFCLTSAIYDLSQIECCKNDIKLLKEIKHHIETEIMLRERIVCNYGN